MRHLIKFTVALLLLAQTTGFSQEKNAETISENQETLITDQDVQTEIDTQKFKSFIGKYLLVEGDFELEIVEENNKMYIVSPFSKDPLIQKNETTLREPTRGVDLSLIADDENALKFTQNGYETVIKRVDSKPGK